MSAGSSTVSPTSVMYTRRLRAVRRASNASRPFSALRTMASASVSDGASSSARGVGSMPARVLTKSGSPSWRRSRPSALLIADCVRPTSRGGARDVAVAQERLEHRQEIEIRRAVHVFTRWMERINAIDLTDNYRSA